MEKKNEPRTSGECPQPGKMLNRAHARVLKFLVSVRREYGRLSKDFSSLLAANNRQAKDLAKMQHKIRHGAHKVLSTRTDFRFYNYRHSGAHCNLENLKF